MVSLYRPLPPTLEAQTGRAGGGRHLYFESGEVRCTTGRLGRGIDIRGNGGYVIVPPSVHGQTGAPYRWTNDLDPAELPEWVIRELGKSKRSQARPFSASSSAIHEGQRNGTLASLAGSMQQRGMSLEAIMAALLADNVARCLPPLPDQEVEKIAKSIHRYPPSPSAPSSGGGELRASRTHSPEKEWPEPMSEQARHGIVGDVVRIIEPTTEADSAAVLVQFLVAFGNIVGREAFFVVEDHRHYPDEFALIVGETAKARKGTSWARARAIFERIEPRWARDCIGGGVGSGEGIIHRLRDAVGKDDAGVADKRLLLAESEFALLLAVASRDGNTTSEVLRRAWDGSPLQVLTKNSPVRAEGAHVSLIGHITVEELLRQLSTTEMANGFANRILFVAARRSKLLPEGGCIDLAALEALVTRLQAAIEFGKNAGEMVRDPAARLLWCELYGDLSEGRPGLFGSLTSRGEAHVLRLSMLYALLDSSSNIRREHLVAALAVWRYADESARCIFGDAVGDAVADEILRALRSRQRAGMTRTEIRDLFHRNKKQTDIQRALGLLAQRGLVARTAEETEGRAIEHWSARGANDINDKDDKS